MSFFFSVGAAFIHLSVPARVVRRTSIYHYHYYAQAPPFSLGWTHGSIVLSPNGRRRTYDDHSHFTEQAPFIFLLHTAERHSSTRPQLRLASTYIHTHLDRSIDRPSRVIFFSKKGAPAHSFHIIIHTRDPSMPASQLGGGGCLHTTSSCHSSCTDPSIDARTRKALRVLFWLSSTYAIFSQFITTIFSVHAPRTHTPNHVVHPSRPRQHVSLDIHK